MLRPITETVLFDLDGTLLDTIGLILESFHHVRDNHFSDHQLEADHFRVRLGVPLVGVFRELVGDDEGKIGELIEDYREHNRQIHDARIRAFDGVPEMLAHLRGRGIRTGIVTSKMGQVAQRGLELCGVAEHLEVLIAVDDVTHHKPHPEPVIRALSSLGVPAGSAMFVGDAPADLRSGRAAGVRTGAVLWGPFERAELDPHRPDHWFEHPRDILAAI